MLGARLLDEQLDQTDRPAGVVVDADVLDVDARSPASANSRASSPGWSGTETKTDRVARAGPPCLPGIASRAGDAAREQLHRGRRGRRRSAASLQDVELLADLGEQAPQRRRR